MKRAVLLIPVALLLGGLPLLRPAHADHPDVRVPRVTGRTLDQAVQTLDGVGLFARVVEVAGVDPDRVSAQDPPAGAMVAAESEVMIQVGVRVQVETRVPDVRGWVAEDALAALDPLYLVEVDEVPARPERDGQVVHQHPGPGETLLYRGVLHLEVARAHLRPYLVPLPSLVGRTYPDAERLLVGMGLVPLPSFLAVPGRPAWSVVRQRPSAGALVEPGSEVALDVALPGTPLRQVAMPHLHHTHRDQAVRVLQALGLRVAIDRVPTAFPDGIVFRQEPEPGTRVAAGSTVRLGVSTGPAAGGIMRVRVPQVQGLALEQAWQALRRAGLGAQIRQRAVPGGAPDVVLSQRPAQGTLVEAGSRVVIEVAVAAATEVPNFVGQPVEAAVRLAREADLRLVYDAEPPAGVRVVVVAQVPEAGQRVSRGSTVRLRLRARTPVEGPGGFVLVPALQGRSVTDAQALLEAQGLVGRFAGPPGIPPDRQEIAAQDPAPGQRVPAGSEVRLTFRARAGPPGPPVPVPGPATVAVPNLRDLHPPELDRAVRAAGLVLRMSVVRGGGPPGVLRQSPAPDTVVPRGSVVQVTYRR